MCLITVGFHYLLFLLLVQWGFYSLILITMGFQLFLSAMQFYYILCLISYYSWLLLHFVSDYSGFYYILLWLCWFLILFCDDYSGTSFHTVSDLLDHYFILFLITVENHHSYFVIITVRHHHLLVWLQMIIISYCFKLQCTIFAFKCFWIWGTLIIFCLDYSGPEHHWWQLPCVGTGPHYWSSSQSPCLLHL